MLLKDLQTLATKLATGTLFHVEKAGKAYSVDYSALAKAIIEEYADSTVGGSKQSVQAAITALNSRITNLRGSAYTGVTVTLLKEHSYIVIYARGIATGTCIYAIATSSDNTMLVDTIYEHADSTLTITNDGLNATFKGNRHGAVLLIDCGSLDW